MTAAAGCLLPKNAIRRCLRSPTLIRVRLIQIMEIHGFTDARFAPVRDAFCRNMEERREVGAAYCVYHRGEVVVDLWAGMADANRGLRWQEDTLAVVFSSTKGVTAILANLLIERDLLDPDLPIAHYWPEFAASGKAGIPVDMILTHRAGIPIIDAPLTLEECLAWDPVIEAIANQKPCSNCRDGIPGTSYSRHHGSLALHLPNSLHHCEARQSSSLPATHQPSLLTHRPCSLQ